MNDPRENVNVLARGQASLSEIFDWYASEFGKSTDDVFRFINQFASAKIEPGAEYRT